MRNSRILLDTNIVIHRETDTVIEPKIGALFRWFSVLGVKIYIHPATERELQNYKNPQKAPSLKIKTESYEVLQTDEKLAPPLLEISKNFDKSSNDYNDTLLLNEVCKGSVGYLITEDKNIEQKAHKIGLSNKIYSIDQFLKEVEKAFPQMKEYPVLSIEKTFFGKIDVRNPFFDSFRADYPEFNSWFLKKSNDPVYVVQNDDKKIEAFLYLKVEDKNEKYDIKPNFPPQKRIKIGSFKVSLHNFYIGERFLKIIFDNAFIQKADAIYTTIFDNNQEKKRLINLLEEWGFVYWGEKITTKEKVYVRDLSKKFDKENPKKTYPYISTILPHQKFFIVPIWPEYHTELFPDSILTTESPMDFKENRPHRNTILKTYISRSIKRNIKRNDILLFYRTSEKDKPAKYNALITTIGVVYDVTKCFENKQEFIDKASKRSIFSKDELCNYWDNNYYKPFLINFLHIYSLNTKQRGNLIRQNLLNLGILTGQKDELRGLKEIPKEHFDLIIKKGQIDESYFVYQT